MILLNNFLFACETCLALKTGQTCEHYEEKGLLSVEKTPVSIGTPRGSPQIKGIQAIQGKYRLMIEGIPKVKKTYAFNKHKDEEILFHKSSNVDITKSIGSCAYDLYPSTRVVLCLNKEYLDSDPVVPYGKANYIYEQTKYQLGELKADQNPLAYRPETNIKDLIASSDNLKWDENYSYFDPDNKKLIEEPIKIRPLSKKGKVQKTRLEKYLIERQRFSNNGVQQSRKEKQFLTSLTLNNETNELIDDESEEEEEQQPDRLFFDPKNKMDIDKSNPSTKSGSNSSDTKVEAIQSTIGQTELLPGDDDNQIILKPDFDKSPNHKDRSSRETKRTYVESAVSEGPAKIENLEFLLKQMDQSISKKQKC